MAGLADSLCTVVTYLAVLAFGIASVMVQSYALSCIFGTLAWSCFYHAFRALIEAQFPKTSVLVDPSDPTWSVAGAYVSFFHQFPVCFAFGFYFLGVHSMDKSWWREGMAGDDWMFRRVEQHLFFATMGYELKDFMKSPFPSIGLIVHHLFTVLGCVQCLLTPLGVGMVCANAVNAQIGSGFFNAFIFYPVKWNFRLFVVMMTISNALGIWLFVEYLSLHLPLVWSVCYGLTVFSLVLIRQGNVLVMCFKRAKPAPENTGDETDPLSRTNSNPPSLENSAV